MAILKANAQPTYKLRPIKVPGRSKPEKGKNEIKVAVCTR